MPFIFKVFVTTVCYRNSSYFQKNIAITVEQIYAICHRTCCTAIYIAIIREWEAAVLDRTKKAINKHTDLQLNMALTNTHV